MKSCIQIWILVEWLEWKIHFLNIDKITPEDYKVVNNCVIKTQPQNEFKLSFIDINKIFIL